MRQFRNLLKKWEEKALLWPESSLLVMREKQKQLSLRSWTSFYRIIWSWYFFPFFCFNNSVIIWMIFFSNLFFKLDVPLHRNRHKKQIGTNKQALLGNKEEAVMCHLFNWWFLLNTLARASYQFLISLKKSSWATWAIDNFLSRHLCVIVRLVNCWMTQMYVVCHIDSLILPECLPKRAK